MTSGMARYRALLGLPGARVPIVASASGSLAIGMFALAILLLVRDATGSFAEAGRVVGAFGLANAIGAGAQGRLMDRPGQPRVLRGVGMRTVFLALAALGAAIGIVQVAVPAFAAAEGSAEAGGLLLAALSAGSLVGGLVYGARSWPGLPSQRLAVLLAALGAGCALIAAAGTHVTVALALLAVGVLLAPATIVGSALLDVVAPAGTVTEAFTVMVMGIVAGTAAGNAVGGAIVEEWSYSAAGLAAAAVAVGGAVGVLVRR